MTRKEVPKGKNAEAIDSIVEVLKEHTEILQKVNDEVGEVISALREKGDFGNFSRVEEKLGRVQKDVGNLSKFLSTASSSSDENNPSTNEKLEPNTSQPVERNSSPAIIRCSIWEEFQEFASQAQSVAFTYIETDRTFEADAVKNNMIVAYVGNAPEFKSMLKTWLSSQMKVSEQKIFEGTLTTA